MMSATFPLILTLILIGEEKKNHYIDGRIGTKNVWWSQLMNWLLCMMVTLMHSILLLQIESMKNPEADPNLFFWMLKKLGTNLNHL